MRHIAYFFVFIAGPAIAENDWTPLSGEQILDRLNNQSVSYKAASQVFYEDGRTSYTAFSETWGTWEVRGDQYCSTWPPASGWACYDMDQDGVRVRFIGESGEETIGWLAQ